MYAYRGRGIDRVVVDDKDICLISEVVASTIVLRCREELVPICLESVVGYQRAYTPALKA